MIVLNTPSAGGGGLPLTGGTLTGPVCVPLAASQVISNARNAGFLFGTSAATAQAGIAAFNNTLFFHTSSANDSAIFPMQLNANEMGFSPNVWIGWSSVAASSGKDLYIGRAAADTLQIGQNHATTPRAQCIKGGNVTTGTAAGFSLELAGGTGATGVRGNVTLNGGNRVANIVAPSAGPMAGGSTVDIAALDPWVGQVNAALDALIQMAISHGLMSA